MSACPDLDALRRSFQERGLQRDDLDGDPFVQFRRWYDEVVAADVHEPEAMVVSTVGPDGMPSSRYVLLKGLDRGFVFFTNYESRKGAELAASPSAAICMPWHVLGRQVRIAGTVEQVTAAESDAYFAARPRGSQIAAWASHQSEPITDRTRLEAQFDDVEVRFAETEVLRPPHWGGYRVLPREFEFWQGRPSRLHDRFRYTLDEAAPAGWHLDRLSP